MSREEDTKVPKDHRRVVAKVDEEAETQRKV